MSGPGPRRDTLTARDQAGEGLEVLEPGLLTTVQDLGRPDLGALGVSPGGAADRWAYRVACVLAGAPVGAPALEMTLVGPTLRALGPMVVGLAGADLGGRVVETGRRLVPGRAHAVAAGETLAFDGPAGAGARAYLAVAGGLDVPVVLGSASTALAGGFGGVGGRPLATGDRLRALALPAGTSADPDRAVPAALLAPPGSRPGVVRVLPGPDAGILDGGMRALHGVGWRVGASSDRMGLRLEGPPIGTTARREIASHGVLAGAVQLPPDGRPIVLLADHQPTGGYPVVAVVIAADLPVLAQLAPGDACRFEPTMPDAAIEARRVIERASAELSERVEASGDRWDALWRSAGA